MTVKAELVGNDGMIKATLSLVPIEDGHRWQYADSSMPVCDIDGDVACAKDQLEMICQKMGWKVLFDDKSLEFIAGDGKLPPANERIFQPLEI
ncbi:MAG: hypothetical protein HZB29_08380 [Nitrospinae bacterium]|nr:hypothetical protein [Nitrospinota bacterium]